jgi:hypothetical protein
MNFKTLEAVSKRVAEVVRLQTFLTCFGAVLVCLAISAMARAQTLLNENWADGSRTEHVLPNEAAVRVGRVADVSVKSGALSVTLTPASQKLWTYFADKEPVTLKVGQKLRATVSFIPRGALSESTSRSLRIGLFHDPTNPRVEEDLNNDAGGPGMPWSDATGYAVQVLVAGGEYVSAKPFDIGKRVNLQSQSLLGTSGDYAKVSGGQPVALALDREYTVTFDVERIAKSQVALTAAYSQGKELLSTWSVTDDGSSLGSEPVYDTFDMLFIRIANSETTADKIDFTNLKVELMPAESR